ncbi:hypothetical protein [Actibacterium lipolyticum]|uniref:Uncharacterized protein n=1 Tax=Actibacterium lipolyticum TaxID=1524263 RepID=A0A238JZG8_9RHOB|nr:hypothetical protein [Actibacterium lipolyticum]SMX35262.1 hypothetical protein COL8621_01731 [Actibacterium lipolyticum]
MKNFFHTMPLEELCARSLEKIRHVTDVATSAEVAGASQNQHAIRRSMDSLSEDRLLRHDGCEALDHVVSILVEELDRETQDIVPVFHGRNDPEEGAIGTVVHERILTPRGAHISGCLGNLRVLREMLLVLEHRLTAERIVNRRFGG